MILLAGLGLASPVCGETMSPKILPATTAGDEQVIVSYHRIDTARGPLAYEARAGRLAIRDEENGDVHGYMFFVAYHVIGGTPHRPITYLWNGGPTAPAWIVQTGGVGPRIRRGKALTDNPETLLGESDLVFMDPVETGFSRPAKPQFAQEFLQFRGDVASTVEFIRAYTMRFATEQQPLFIGGESYGVFRAAAVADELTQRGIKLAGSILISGDIPNIPQPTAFYDAMHVPARAATAFYYKRLPAELLRDRTATMNEVMQWVRDVYQPALARRETLSDAEREAIAHSLSRYTGIADALISRETLVVYQRTYVEQFFGGDLTRQLNSLDTRAPRNENPYGPSDIVDTYLRDELRYPTDLTYRGVERGYVPTPGPTARSAGDQFYYNQPGVNEDTIAEVLATHEVTPIAQANPPWIVDALKRDKTMQVFVATGRFDPSNMCEGDVIVTATLPADLSSRISNRCYESGHIIVADEEARRLFLRDVAAFIRAAAARSSSPAYGK